MSEQLNLAANLRSCKFQRLDAVAVQVCLGHARRQGVCCSGKQFGDDPSAQMIRRPAMTTELRSGESRNPPLWVVLQASVRTSCKAARLPCGVSEPSRESLRGWLRHHGIGGRLGGQERLRRMSQSTARQTWSKRSEICLVSVCVGVS